MAVCPVCGCKTDALDFVESKIGATDVSVCSFCHRQLNVLNTGSAGEAQLNWLKAVLAKEVTERSTEVFTALEELYEKNGGSFVPAEQPQAEPYATPTYTAAPSRSATGNKAEGEQVDVAQLLERVEKLEKQLASMKRSMLFKTICEIALPIIMGIIILIVFFSSDFYGELSYMFESFMGY
jgi:hypothetical protein